MDGQMSCVCREFFLHFCMIVEHQTQLFLIYPCLSSTEPGSCRTLLLVDVLLISRTVMNSSRFTVVNRMLWYGRCQLVAVGCCHDTHLLSLLRGYKNRGRVQDRMAILPTLVKALPRGIPAHTHRYRIFSHLSSKLISWFDFEVDK